MTRLVVTLNVLVLGVLLVYVIHLDQLAAWVLSRPLEAYYQAQGRGPLALLNASVQGLSPSRRDAEVERLRAHFPYGLALRPRRSMSWSPREEILLSRGAVVVRGLSRDRTAYAVLPDSGLVWEIALDQPLDHDERQSVRGIIHLIERALA